MSFPTDWDVDRYRADYESEEHWELRKAFIEAHKDKFAENELVCLAQVFTNIEFLGCRYPNKTMERVAHLSKDVAEKFRALRSGRLKRTFMGASDAASAKAKGRSSQSQTITKPNNHNTQQKSAFPSLQSSFTKQQSSAEEIEISSTITSTSTKTTTTSSSSSNTDQISNKHKLANKSDSDSDDGQMARPSFALNSSSTTNHQQDHLSKIHQHNELPSTLPDTFQSKPNLLQQRRIPDTGFIIYETLSQNGQQQLSINILQVSAAKQGATIKCDVEVGKTQQNTLDCVVRINDTTYGMAPITTGKKEAKVQAFDNALQYARKIHYTIKQKSLHTVSVDVEQNGVAGSTMAIENPHGKQLDADNKGFKMMKMLGWSGGALGISGNGIEQPISIEMKVDRSGLGLSSDSTKLNYEFFVEYLTKYKTDETATYDLAFSKDFTKDERKTLHEIANRLSLKSRSHNTPDGSRYIIIFKRLELMDLANEIQNNGLRSKCYELIAPTNPLPEKPRTITRPQPAHLTQRTANKIGLNYTLQNKFKQKRKKYF